MLRCIGPHEIILRDLSKGGVNEDAPGSYSTSTCTYMYVTCTLSWIHLYMHLEISYIHTCRYRILTYMCIQYEFYVTHMHVTHKVNRNKCKTLCAEYMCDIEIYVPHTCMTWILCHT